MTLRTTNQLYSRKFSGQLSYNDSKGKLIRLYIKEYPSLTDYDDKYRLINQQFVCGVPLNPTLRPDFDITDYRDRDPEELEDWENTPYIVSRNWEQIEEALVRDMEILKAHSPHKYASQLSAMVEHLSLGRTEWFKAYPSGTCYEVRCLDRRFSERPSVWGTTSTLIAAIKLAKNGKEPEA